MSNNIRLLILLCAALLSGCATPPEQRYGAPSTAFSQPETTTAGKIFETEIAQNPGKSGVEILPLAGAAFRTRNAMARVAEKSLDVQYFIWEADNTGRILAYQLLEAADRGVRVRLLLDDINFRGRDIGIAAMDLHPNIEVRLRNWYPKYE